jgi:choline-sulfatase
MSDQHNPDISSAYGNDKIKTPNLDRLMQEGVVFDNAYCNNPICVPSRMSFLSGQTTQQIECWSLSDTMKSDTLTWPTLLGSVGYDTAMSGRMHMWYPDKYFGFQERLCGDTQTRVATGTYDIYEAGEERDKVVNRFKKQI